MVLINRIVALILSLFLGMAATAVIASPANAASGNVTVTATTNQCPQGGSVVMIWYSIDKGGVVNAQPGDSGTT